jgi:Holliday junction resolvase-like predicted endonuclease
VTIGGGELDLIAVDGRHRVVIEVRTVTGESDPIDAVPDRKRRRVRGLAGAAGGARVDVVGVGLRSWGAEIHWLPG